MRCLVTGGRGFIGSHLVNYLKKKGHYVRSVDINALESCHFPQTNEDKFLNLDLRESKLAELVCQEIDVIFHLAANVGGIGYIMNNHSKIMRDNVLINSNMLEATRKNDIKRFFFSSSACVYPIELQDNPDAPPLTEDVPFYNPDSAYGWEKLYMEQMCRYYMKDYGLQTRVARFHNVYGVHVRPRERMKAPMALCVKILETLEMGTIEVWGDGLQTRSFLHITDCLEAVYQLTMSNYPNPLNVGTDFSISINDLANMIIQYAGKRLGLRHDLDKPQGVRGRNADLTRICQVLDWKPKISLEEGIRELYSFVLEHRNCFR